MVVSQINIRRVAFLKTKNDAQVGRDRNAPETLQVALERVQPPPGKQSDLLRLGGFVNRQQDVTYLPHEGRGNALDLPCFVKCL
jgi:hypothetical protein